MTHHGRLVGLAVLLGLGVLFLSQMYQQSLRPHGNDLTVYLTAARALAHGQDPYAIDLPQGFRAYPLTIAVLTVPLTWLPAWLAQLVWFVSNVAALIGSLVILDRVWSGTSDGASPTLRIPFVVRFAVITLALLIPLRKHFYLGQASLVALCLCCLFLQAHLADRRLSASMWLGGAIALKLTPVLFLVSLIRERKYPTLVLSGGWVIVWAILLPALVSARVFEFYREGWFLGVIAHLDMPVTQARHTLAAALVHLWPGFEAIPGFRYWAAAMVVVPIVWAQGRVPRDVHGRLMIFALYLVAIPLISPLSWSHHLVFLVAPLSIWMLAAGEFPALRAVELVGAVLFLSLHWFRVLGRPPGFDALALVVLYLVLLMRGIQLGEDPARDDRR